MSFGCFQLPRLNMEVGEFAYHKAVAMDKGKKSIWPNKYIRSYFLKICLCIGGTTVRKLTSE